MIPAFERLFARSDVRHIVVPSKHAVVAVLRALRLVAGSQVGHLNSTVSLSQTRNAKVDGSDPQKETFDGQNRFVGQGGNDGVDRFADVWHIGYDLRAQKAYQISIFDFEDGASSASQHLPSTSVLRPYLDPYNLPSPPSFAAPDWRELWKWGTLSSRWRSLVAMKTQTISDAFYLHFVLS